MRVIARRVIDQRFRLRHDVVDDHAPVIVEERYHADARMRIEQAGEADGMFTDRPCASGPTTAAPPSTGPAATARRARLRSMCTGP
jgi:hypothetical protein